MKKDKEHSLLTAFEEKLDLLCGKAQPLSVLVALSGGADSVALLLFCKDLLKKRGGRVEAYHLNHRIRGEEADGDALFCRALCAELGIILHLEERDVPTIAKETKKGLEETARQVRYDRLEEVRSRRALSYIATAHNAEDQLETMLFRMARGTSLKGLCGIPQKRGTIIRPLLSVSGEALRAYCGKMGICYRVDSTNFSDDYARNDLRHHALPAMKRVNSASAAHGVALAEALLEDEELLCSLVPSGRLSREQMNALHPAVLRRYLVREVAEKRADAGLEGAHLKALCRLVKEGEEGASLSLPGCLRVRIFKGGLRFEEDKKKKEDYRLPVCGECTELPEGRGVFWVTERQKFDEFCLKNRKIHKLFNKEVINSATIKGALFVRPVQKGDRIRIGGMTRRVCTLLGEMKVPMEERESYPLLCDDKGVLWLPGKAPRDGSKEGECDLVLCFTDREDRLKKEH
ncbi:MAG: tRNA lysidine(34) synthetase TilS [Clostridia bacterium]|nr:tRNA lysidine(34) synthetase TilS [Clostridia bacterium]